VAGWRHPAPGLRVRKLLELLRAGDLLGSVPKVPTLAGGRIPQLEHLKIAACRTTCLVKHQKPRKKMKNLDKTTYGKSYHSHLPRAAGGTFLPAEDPPDLWGPSPAFEPPGGGVGDGGLISDGGGGVAGRCPGGGGGGVCCLGGGRC
jgi:hypothetical protein